MVLHITNGTHGQKLSFRPKLHMQKDLPDCNQQPFCGH